MQQVTQKLGSGALIVQEVPRPLCGPGMILVRTHYSLISAGTEASTVKTARAGLIEKARQRPQQVKQVLEVVRRQGPVQAYRAVIKKLESYSPLGYSASGKVIEIGEGVRDVGVGDFVACGGAGFANHAEIIAVPSNLCVRLPLDANLGSAAYNTLGAIALQGVRQAGLCLGESCAVIGLGLIGQLTCLLLRASGVRVIGIDIDASAVSVAHKHSADLALERSSPGTVEQIAHFTRGLGVDAVIITASTNSLDPVNFAGEICRKKGRVVVVGSVPTGFDREPHYYRKELELRMSCSYGPGRYDPEYEELGRDYPPAYVRWTERRNMEAFQEMLHSGRLDVGFLTTHAVALKDAPAAYDMIVSRSEPFLGVLIRYDVDRPSTARKIQITEGRKQGKVGLAFIGAGSYAQSSLLPHLPKSADVNRKMVLANTGTTSKRVAERFGFESCTDRLEDVLQDAAVNTVFVTTRHDSHAAYVVSCLKSQKNVFVEKPLALNEEELEGIAEAATRTENGAPRLLVGFNRRFSPLSVQLKKRLSANPVAMIYRVNAGLIDASHWTQNMDIGGGRIIGEACHFIDLMTFLAGALPVSIFSSAMTTPEGTNDTVTIQVTFGNGSIGTVHYFSNGDKRLPKEYLEVYQSQTVAVLDDFRSLAIYSGGQVEKVRLRAQDKGQAAMVESFVDAVKSTAASPIGFDEIYAVSLAAIAAYRSIGERAPIRLGSTS